jgi:hypothetical protein
VYTGNFNMVRVGLYWILGKEKCTQHLNHGLGVRVGGERRNLLGKGNSTQQWRTQKFFFGPGGVQQIQLKTEGRENRDRRRKPPSQGFRPISKGENPVFLLGS